jgi:hypothetical protein
VLQVLDARRVRSIGVAQRHRQALEVSVYPSRRGGVDDVVENEQAPAGRSKAKRLATNTAIARSCIAAQDAAASCRETGREVPLALPAVA